jgi:hypothetical protein
MAIRHEADSRLGGKSGGYNKSAKSVGGGNTKDTPKAKGVGVGRKVNNMGLGNPEFRRGNAGKNG